MLSNQWKEIILQINNKTLGVVETRDSDSSSREVEDIVEVVVEVIVAVVEVSEGDITREEIKAVDITMAAEVEAVVEDSVEAEEAIKGKTRHLADNSCKELAHMVTSVDFRMLLNKMAESIILARL